MLKEQKNSKGTDKVSRPLNGNVFGYGVNYSIQIEQKEKGGGGGGGGGCCCCCCCCCCSGATGLEESNKDE